MRPFFFGTDFSSVKEGYRGLGLLSAAVREASATHSYPLEPLGTMHSIMHAMFGRFQGGRGALIAPPTAPSRAAIGADRKNSH